MTGPAATTKPKRTATAQRPRGTLSRDEIISTGLEIARKTDDLNQLTMKKLADALSVTPMAIYRHFENKAEIIDAVLDRLVQNAQATGQQVDRADWKPWLRETFLRIHTSFISAPGTLSMLDSLSRFGPGLFTVVDDILAVLRGAGFSDKQAVDALTGLISVTIGSVMIDSLRERSVTEILQGTAELTTHTENDPTALGTLTSMGEALLASQNQAAIENGLDTMLDVIENWLN